MPTKVLFINQETSPYVPDTPTGLLCRQLLAYLFDAGCETRTFMPKWGVINERRGQLHEVIRLSGMNLIINGNDHPLLIKVASLPASRAQVYFIDNEEYFSRRRMLFDDDGSPCPDNGERALFFVRGALEMVRKLRWCPDVIICQGWLTAVAPLYVRCFYADEPCFAESKIITSLFAEGFAGVLEDDFRRGMESEEEGPKILKQYNQTFDFAELQRLAIDFSDGLVVASPHIPTATRDYALASRKPVVTLSDGNLAARYKAFIDTIINKK